MPRSHLDFVDARGARVAFSGFPLGVSTWLLQSAQPLIFSFVKSFWVLSPNATFFASRPRLRVLTHAVAVEGELKSQHAVRGSGFRGVASQHRDAAGPAHGYQEHVRADGAG